MHTVFHKAHLRCINKQNLFAVAVFLSTQKPKTSRNDEEDDGIPFADKMAALTTTLKQQIDKEAELNQEIEKQLSKIGFASNF
jgi:hypothetical protein